MRLFKHLTHSSITDDKKKLGMISGLASTLTVAAFSLGLVLSNSKVIDANIQKGDSNVVDLTLAVHTGEQKTWNDLAEKFRQTPGNENISLQIKVFHNDFKREAKNSHLVYTDIIWLPEFVESGIIMPINTNLIQKFGVSTVDELVTKGGFLETEIEHGKYQPPDKPKQLYRIPFRTDMGVLYYRKDLLTKYAKSVPHNYNELIKIAKEIQNSHRTKYGYLWQGTGEGAATMFLEVLHGHGGFWVKDRETDINKKVGLADPEAIDAIKFLRKTLHEKISNRDFNETYTDKYFMEGEAVFLRSWVNVWNKVQDNSESPVKGKIEIMPMVANISDAWTSCQGGWGLALSKKLEGDSARIDAAMRAIVSLTSADSQKQFALKQGTLPTIKYLFYDKDITWKYPHYEKLYKDFIHKKKLVPRPRTVKYEKLSNILRKTLNLVLDLNKDNVTVTQIMKDSAELTRNCLRERNPKSSCEKQGKLVKL
jgi:multiple sugar transport system substrate-binding protein